MSEDIKKPCPKATLNYINNLINNHTFNVEDPEKKEPVTPCMDIYKVKIQSDGILDKLKLRTGVREDIEKKEFVGYNWSPTASMRPLKSPP